MIYEEYEGYLRKYKKEFGDQTVVLFECGSFFEIYDDGQGLTNMKEISELLNILISRRNKSILEVSRNNFEMAGFPSHSLKKYISILLSNNYTVILVTQVTPPPNPKRAVTEILSPGTNIEVNQTDSSNLMVIYIEENEKYKAKGVDITVGCSIIDLSTGKSDVYETSSFGRDPCFPFDEIHRLISIYSPREIDIISQATEDILSKFQDQVDYQAGFAKVCLHRNTNIDVNLLKKEFQENIISRVFKNTGLLSPIEFLNLERKPAALTSYVRLLQFALIHNENIVSRIKVPGILEENNTLLLSHSAAQQLDIVNRESSKNGSLLNLLNNCKTAIGKRYFKKRLLNPFINITDITRLYDSIDNMTNEDMSYKRDMLSRVYDIERLFRKCIMGVIQPNEFFNLITSINVLESLRGGAKNINDSICKVLNIDKLSMYNYDSIDGNIFIDGYDDCIDIYNGHIKRLLTHLNNIVSCMNSKGSSGFKLDNNEKEGYYISNTLKRFQEFLRNADTITTDDGLNYKTKEFTYKTLSNTIKISHPTFCRLNDEINTYKSKLTKKSLELYKGFIQDFVKDYECEMDSYVSYLEEIDYLTTMRYNKNIFRLSRPNITAGPSAINIKGARHLIIEKNQLGIKYVSNDVNICSVGDNSGMLLYGINSAGKSSLMKSIGIMVIMAQAGMYVPCEELHLSPYTKIFTRILSNDDIFRGQSTFTKEIIELRNILKRVDDTSLVIGDELCSGTESVSALAIVSAGIVTLAKKNTSFVFATHLHDLVNIDDVKSLANVKTYHLSVTFDEKKKTLVYDRKLKEGNGSTLYGIEVCKSLDLDHDFLELANSVRRKVMKVEDEIPKTSVYNSKLLVTECAICKTRGEEVHHIEEQRMADADGYISAYHKNSLFNLVCLCQKCHDDVHGGKLNINGYIQTSKGRDLIVTKNETTNQAEYPGKAELEEYIYKIKNIEASKPISKKDLYNQITMKYKITKYRVDKILGFRI